MIEKGAGARDYPAVAGLARAMPLTATVIALAALSMAGVPPLFGFIGKELDLRGDRPRPAWAPAVTAAALAANALMVACAGDGGAPPVLPRARRAAPRTGPPTPTGASALGPVILAALGLLCGLAPALIGDGLVAPMVAAVVRARRWTATSRSGTASARRSSSASLTFALGAVALPRPRPHPRRARRRRAVAAAHRGLVRRRPRAASPPWRAALTGAVQNGRMTSYLRAHLPRPRAPDLGRAPRSATARWPRLALSPELIDWAIVGIIVASIVVVLRTPSRLTAITALGGVGAGIAIVFVLYGAIDVAMTQLFVEILVVVFLAIAMVRLPPAGARAVPRRQRAGRRRSSASA